MVNRDPKEKNPSNGPARARSRKCPFAWLAGTFERFQPELREPCTRIPPNQRRGGKEKGGERKKKGGGIRGH